jgi:hypothetical protein
MQRRLLCDVRDHRFSPTTVVGAISTAATTGALVAIGHRMGHAGAPFVAIASVLVRGATPIHGVGDGSVGTVLGGVLLHAAATFFWSALCISLAVRLRSQSLAALVVSVVNFLVSGLVVSSMGRGLASELTLGDRVIYAVALAASLIVGMRYAFLHPRETATS